MSGVRGEPDSWWTLWPTERERELAAYARHGADVTLVHEANGLLVLEVQWPYEPEQPLTLRVGYSTLHPFCRPAITASGDRFPRHQNPVTQGLCLLAQDDAHWRPGELVADMIDRQLATLRAALSARAAGDVAGAAAHEETFADPLSAYYQGLGEVGSAVYFARSAQAPGEVLGLAGAICQLREAGLGEQGRQPLEILLTNFERPRGQWFAAKFDLPQRSGRWQPLAARWVRASPRGCVDGAELLAAAEAAARQQGAADAATLRKWIAAGDAAIALTILVTEDETDYAAGATGDGFIFLLSRRTGKRRAVSVVRGLGVSGEIFARLPLREALRGKSALLVGCGAIGSFVAIELARAGFKEVVLVDPDVVEPGNYVRWALGRPCWGLSKALVLAATINQHYPWTRAEWISARVGAAVTETNELQGIKRNPFVDLQARIEATDIVVDATASSECQRALAFLCKTMGRPLVIGHGTLGAAGGMVAQFRAAPSACYNCAHEGWEADGLPKPPVDEAGKLVPVGCNAETFTGGSYDLQEISLQMVRSALGLAAPEAFDAGDWDVAVLSHVRDGRRIPPSWVVAKARPHLSCCLKAA